MLQSDFENLISGNKRWLSYFSGMVLLSWDFSPSQIKTIYQYRQEFTTTAVIPPTLLNSEAYVNSDFKITDNPKYLYYDETISELANIPGFCIYERAFLSKFNGYVLRSWGFSHRLINKIKISSQIPSHLHKIPIWLTKTAKYKESVYKIETVPVANQTVSSFAIDWSNLTHLNVPQQDTDEEDEDEDDVCYVDEEDEEETTISQISIDPENETAHDLQVKYQDTYGLYNDKPVRLIDITSKSNSPYGYEIKGYYYDHQGSANSTFAFDNILNFNMLVPKLGFINHDKLCLFIERKHKKSSPTKYRKGLRADNLIITNISSADYKEAYNKDDPYSTYSFGEECVLQRILHSLFLPVFYTYEDALNLLLSFKRLSCAISPNIAMALNFKTNKIMLYRNQFTVGVFNSKMNVFKLETDLFTNDLIKIGVKVA